MKRAFVVVVSSCLLSGFFAGTATAAKTPLALAGNSSGSDSVVTGSLDVHWLGHATCNASLRAHGRHSQLGIVHTAAAGGGRWTWIGAAGAPGGRWLATVRCTLGGKRVKATQPIKVPRSVSHRRSTVLVRRGSIHGQAYDGFAGKGVGLGSGGADPYPHGQCTWYAWLKRQDLPWFSGESGNARNWYTSAQRHGIPTGTVPVAGSIVVFQPGQDGAGGYGHVAYVEAVSGSSITISEANYHGAHVRETIEGVAIEIQTISSSGLHFIYGGPAGNGPGAASPAPPPPAGTTPSGAFPHHVYHTCANGACGLKVHSAPSLSASVTSIKNDGDEVFVVCQTSGDRVYGIDGSSSEVWDKLNEGGYASDFYIDTPGTNGSFSPPIPSCSSAAPAPPPSGPTAVTHYNCTGTPEAFGHNIPPGKHWGNNFTAQGSIITGGYLLVGAAEDGGNHQASIGIFTGGPYTLSGELGSVTVNVSGYGGTNFTFPTPIHVTPGQELWLVASAIGYITGYDQNNGGSDGCFIGSLTGTQ